MKKLISIIIMLTMVISLESPAFAGDIKTISLQDAINTAETNNSSLKLLDEKIKLAERKYNNALSSSTGAANKYWSSSDERVSNAKTEFVTPLQKKADLDELKQSQQDTEKALKLNVTTLYYQILFKQQMITTQQQSITRAKSEYEIKKKQADAGIISASALLSYEISTEQAQNTLDALQNGLDGLFIDLNQELGYNMEQKLVLKSEALAVEKYAAADIDKLAANVVAASDIVNKVINDKAIKEKERWVYSGYSYGETPDEVETLDQDIIDLDYKIRDEKLNVEYKVRSDYNNLLNLYDDITLKNMAYNQIVKLLNVAKTRYELGISSLLDYQKAQGDKDAAWDEYNQAQLNYYLAVEKFKDYINPVVVN